ncbi:MAG: hypothetical protein PHF65_05995 [Oscillospiraceae bacterium]|nr:hypothetical protein [Oscillospiraceae bacterium]
MYENLIDVNRQMSIFRLAGLDYTVSGRNLGKHDTDDIMKYLCLEYMYCDHQAIRSVFNHTTDYSPLYGGRKYSLRNALNDHHIGTLRENGIGIALTLTNHFFDEEKYSETIPLLKKHHDPINSVICTNDDLALRIRNEFPDYTVKASLLKNIETIENIEKACQLYDQVVIPMNKNDDNFFLRSIPNKDRIILFGNATCAYNCPNRICYYGFSLGKKEVQCSKRWIPREDKGFVFFNVEAFLEMGFRHIKLVPDIRRRKTAGTGFPKDSRGYKEELSR